MYRVIDLDAVAKESEGMIFLVNLNGEKVGFSDLEVSEALKSKNNLKGRKGARGQNNKNPNNAEPSDMELSPELISDNAEQGGLSSSLS